MHEWNLGERLDSLHRIWLATTDRQVRCVVESLRHAEARKTVLLGDYVPWLNLIGFAGMVGQEHQLRRSTSRRLQADSDIISVLASYRFDR